MRLTSEDMYLDLLHTLMTEAIKGQEVREDRTKTGTYSRFGDQLRFNLEEGFPLLTTKKVFWKGVAEELFWFLRGETNISSLQEKGVHIWDEWATEEGDLGPVYGAMWRSWPTSDSNPWSNVDQLMDTLVEIINNPTSRRLVVSGWNPAYLPDSSMSPKENAKHGKQALPPCHCLFQFYVKDGKLSCHLYQRSADIFLGVPFNIASYALLTHIVANIANLEVGEFIVTFGDIHLYSNHVEAATEQLKRTPKDYPVLKIKRKLTLRDINTLSMDDLELSGYDPYPPIKAEVSV